MDGEERIEVAGECLWGVLPLPPGQQHAECGRGSLGRGLQSQPKQRVFAYLRDVVKAAQS